MKETVTNYEGYDRKWKAILYSSLINFLAWLPLLLLHLLQIIVRLDFPPVVSPSLLSQVLDIQTEIQEKMKSRLGHHLRYHLQINGFILYSDFIFWVVFHVFPFSFSPPAVSSSSLHSFFYMKQDLNAASSFCPHTTFCSSFYTLLFDVIIELPWEWSPDVSCISGLFHLLLQTFFLTVTLI